MHLGSSPKRAILGSELVAHRSEMARRIAENEARFRDANEKIEAAVKRLEPSAVTIPFVCECGRPDCLQTLRLTVAEYELARQNPRYFACAPGHQLTGPGLGRLVEERGNFVICRWERSAAHTRSMRSGVGRPRARDRLHCDASAAQMSASISNSSA